MQGAHSVPFNAYGAVPQKEFDSHHRNIKAVDNNVAKHEEKLTSWSMPQMREMLTIVRELHSYVYRCPIPKGWWTLYWPGPER